VAELVNGSVATLMNGRNFFQSLPDSKPETVVLFVSAEPEPRDDITLVEAKRSIVFAPKAPSQCQPGASPQDL